MEVSLYGSVAGAYTQSFWSVLGSCLLTIMFPVWFGVYKDDPLPLRIIFHIHIPIILALFTFIGVLYSTKRGMKKMVDLELRSNPRFFAFAILFFIGVVGYYFATPSFLPDEPKVIGYVLLFISISLGVGVIAIHGMSHKGVAEIRWLASLFIILWSVPAAYTHLLFVEGGRPWQGWITLMIIPAAFFVGSRVAPARRNQFFLELGIYTFVIWAIGFYAEQTTSGGCVGFACSDVGAVLIVFWTLIGLWIGGLIYVLNIVKA